MSSRRKFSGEFKVEAAHRVIDSGRPVAQVARELTVSEFTLGRWVRDERTRMEAWMRNRVGAINRCGKSGVAPLTQSSFRAGKGHLFPGKSLYSCSVLRLESTNS